MTLSKKTPRAIFKSFNQRLRILEKKRHLHLTVFSMKFPNFSLTILVTIKPTTLINLLCMFY